MQCADNRMNMVFKRKMPDTGILNVPRQDLRCTGLSTNDRYSDQFFVFIYWLYCIHVHVWLQVLFNAIMLKFWILAWRFLPTIHWILEALCAVITVFLSYKTTLIVCKFSYYIVISSWYRLASEKWIIRLIS